MTKLVTFMFHRLGKPRFTGDVYSVPAEWLSRLIEMADAQHCPFVRLDTIPEIESDLQQVYATLTFDDGYLSDFEAALPILQARQIPATFFIVPNWIGQPGYLNWTQVRSLAEANMLIGSHTLSHPWLPELSADALRRELADSRNRIADRIGRAVETLSLPGGYYNRRVLQVAYQAGYRLIASSNYGLDRITDLHDRSDWFLRRNSVDLRSSWDYLAGLLSGKDSLRVQWVTGGKRQIANLLGPTRYKQISDLIRRRE